LIHSVNLYVVLKKTVRSEDQVVTNCMAVRVCNGLEQMTGQVKPKYINSRSGVSTGSHAHGNSSRCGSNSTGSQKYQNVVTQVTVNEEMVLNHSIADFI
jgi:hypothetical protein